jgi:hypothetical protein
VGDTKKLPIILAPKNAWAELVWVSSNPEVATVDQQGKLTALAPGDTVVSVSAGNLSANCTITVVDSQHKSGVKYKLGQDKSSLDIPKEILKEKKELDISHGKMQIIVPTTAWLEALAQLGLDESASVLVEVEQFTPELPQDLMAVGMAYSFNLYAGEVRISNFADKLLLTMSYDPDLVMYPEKLAIYWFNTETEVWDKLPSLVDTDNNTVTVLLTHWSSFALLEPVVQPFAQGD